MSERFKADVQHNDFKGTKAAALEYFTPLGITPIPLADKSGSAVVVAAK